MRKRFALLLGAGTALGGLAGWGVLPASAHCEIPCGIYGDEMRVQKIAEDLITIEKSMQEIENLSKDPKAHMNQLVRWVQNKEAHADDIRRIVTQYFLAQRVKAPEKKDDRAAEEKYHRQLRLLHGMIVQAMKAKQTTDPAHVKNLRGLLKEFKAAYFGPEKQAHLETRRGAP